MLRNLRELAAELLDALLAALQPAPEPEPRRHVHAAGGCWCGRDHARGDAIPGQPVRRYPSAVLLAVGADDSTAWLDGGHLDPETTVVIAQVDLGERRLAGVVRGRRFDSWHATDAAQAHPAYTEALAFALPTVAAGQARA